MHLEFQTLRPRRAKIQRIEQSVEPNDVRQIIVEIGRADPDATIAKALLDSHVETAIALGIQIEIVSENLILTARRAEPGCVTRVQRRVGRLDRDNFRRNDRSKYRRID